MINFDKIDKDIERLKDLFGKDGIFEYVVIDDFCDADKLLELVKQIPDPNIDGVNKSRDYMFAKNKFEKSKYSQYGELFSELHKDLVSDRFKEQLKIITGEDVFVDEEFHGGGLHQGGAGSYLNMHADFNFHPVHNDWFRNLNILLYLNHGWKKEYGGQLKLKHKTTGERAEVEPLFNRCVIMFTRDYTLHGYDPISFPDGHYRRSLAAYAYSKKDSPDNVRSTTWYPEDGGVIKKMLGKNWPKLVKVKNKLFGSSTTKNK